MSVMIQVLLAAVMTASGLLISSAGQAASPTAAIPSLMPVFVAQIDLGMPQLAPETSSPIAAQQVIPEQLLNLESLTPCGSFSWAGIDEFAELDAAPMAERKDLKRKTAAQDKSDEIDPELLTAAPAPEPPTSVLAGIALVAGGIWTRARRR
jgi:hypothetical protein